MFFETSRPVTRTEFFNRKRELRELQQTVDILRKGNTRYLALLGPRKIGKTSLMRQFMVTLDDPQVPSFLLDCWEKRPTPDTFFQDYLVQTIDSFLQSGGAPGCSQSLRASLLSESRLLAALADLQSSGISSLVRASELLLALRARDYSDTLFAGILDLPEQVAQETDRYWVVLLDEFQELQALNQFKAVQEYAGDVFALLRSRWQQHRRVNYIVAGSRLTMMRDILIRERAPLFQHFRLVEVSPFSDDDARKLVEDLSRSAGRAIPRDLISRLVQLVGCQPFYLQVLGSELCTQPELDETAFKQVFQETLFDATGTLYLYFQDMVGRMVGRSASLERTLIQLAHSPGTLTKVARDLGVPTGGLKSWIDRVADLVIVEDGVYQIADPALRLWLKSRSEVGLALPPLVLGDEAEKMVASRMAATGFDLVYQSRASRGAFDLLAILGSKELGVQVKKSGLPYYLTRDELQRMQHVAKNLSRTPILALVDEGDVRFYDVRALRASGRSCKIDSSTPSIENMFEV